MSAHSEFFFPSSDGKTQIHAEQWLPEGEIKAVLQISHGVSEYVGRYAPFAEYLTQNGFAVIGGDHLGHGKSVAEGAPRIYFGEHDGWKHVVDDVARLRAIGKEKFPNVPYFIMGHSMGSFITRTYLIRYPGEVDGAVIMGTGQQSPLLTGSGRLIAKIIGGRQGFGTTSKTVNSLAFGSYNKPFEPKRTEFDWLSANPDNVDRYIADPLCGEDATVGLFYEMLGGIRFVGKQGNVNKMDTAMPVLFISGADDPVGGAKGAAAAYNTFKKAGVSDLTLKLYPGLRHEILNERKNAEIYEYIRGWLEERI